MLSTHFGGIADEWGPPGTSGWSRETSSEPLIAEVATMLTSQDIVQILTFRIQDKFVASTWHAGAYAVLLTWQRGLRPRTMMSGVSKL